MGNTRKILFTILAILLTLSTMTLPASARNLSAAVVSKPSAPTITSITSSAPKKNKVNLTIVISLPSDTGGMPILGSKVIAKGVSCSMVKLKTVCQIKNQKIGKTLTFTAQSKNKKGFGKKSSSVSYTVNGQNWTLPVAAAPITSTPIAAPPAPPTSAPVSLGAFWSVHSSGSLDLNFIWKNTSDGSLYKPAGLPISIGYSSNYSLLDVWENHALTCPSVAGCIGTMYSNSTTGYTPTAISFSNIMHPDYATSGIINSADFGIDKNQVITQLKYQPVDGLKDVIYRYDIPTQTRTPIFATYCTVASYTSCAAGARISEIRVDHYQEQIYFVLEVGIFSASNKYLVSIPLNANPVTLKHKTEVSGISFEGSGLIYRFTETDTSKKISNMSISSSGNYLYFVRSNVSNSSTGNEICRLNVNNGDVNCILASAFARVMALAALDDSKVYFDTFSLSSNPATTFKVLDFAELTIKDVSVPNNFYGASDLTEGWLL